MKKRPLPQFWILILAILVFGTVASFGQHKDRDLPEFKDGHVAIPWADFKGLLEKLMAGEPGPDILIHPPFPYALGPLSLDGKILPGDLAKVEGVLEIAVLESKDWVTVPLWPTGSLAISEVSLDGKPATLAHKNNRVALVLKGRALHRLRVVWMIPLRRSGAEQSLFFDLPKAPVVTLTLDIPQIDLEAHLDQGVKPVLDVRGQHTFVKAALPAGRSNTLRWSKAPRGKDSGTGRVTSVVQTQVKVGQGLMSCTSQVLYTLWHTQRNEFKLRVPKGTSLLDVQGAGVDEWKEIQGKEGDKSKIVKVSLNYKAESSYSITLR